MQNTRRTPRKIVLVTVLVVAAVATLAVGGYYTWLISPPPLPQTPDDVLAVIGSARYERLPDYRKQQYLTEAERLMRDMPDEQRQQWMQKVRGDEGARDAMRQVWRQMMTQRAIEFARADPARRAEILDEDMARMEQMRQRRNQMRGENNGGDQNTGGGRGGRPGPNRADFRDHIEERFQHGNPQINALIGEYHRARRQRREQAGQ